MLELCDLNKMSYEELQALAAATAMVIGERKDARRNELIQEVCKAMNNLYAEFPGVELTIYPRCSECGNDLEIDVLHWLCAGRNLLPQDFSGR